MRRGAHAGFVGEQAALCALAQSGDDAEGGAAYRGLRVEGALEDQGQGCRQVGDVGDDDCQAADQVDNCHDRHQLFRDGGNAGNAADEHEAGQHCHDDAHGPRGNAEGGVAGGCDGVGLNHAAHEAQGQDDGHGEEAGQDLAAGALKGSADVVDRTAVDGAVGHFLTGCLGKHGLGVVGGHAQEGDDPHPEDGARATDQDSAAGTHDVASTHLGSDGGCHCLEGAHAALLGAAAQGKVAEEFLYAFTEAANLHEAGAQGEEQAGAYKQDDKYVIR